MSTRSIIMITGIHKHNGPETVRLYKHSDGYPTGALPTIADAIKAGRKQVEEQAERFKEKVSYNFNPSQMVGNVIGADVSVYGMGAQIDIDLGDKQAVYEAKLKPEHFGTQSDLEWIYVINLATNTLSIHGGGYSGKDAQVLAKKLADPYAYANALYAEYQQKELDETESLIKEIEALGFKVKHAPRKALKAKAKNGK